MNYVNTNRINNLLPRYCIENTEENFKKLEHVIEKKILLFTNRLPPNIVMRRNYSQRAAPRGRCRKSRAQQGQGIFDFVKKLEEIH